MSLYSANFHWFRERLTDPSLLEQAVKVAISGGLSDIAVPIGGRRRGGFLPLGTKADVRAVVRQLRRYPSQFPNLRAVYSTSREVCHNVRWGEDEPEVPSVTASDREWMEGDRQCGLLYGYSDSAIAAFIAEQYGVSAAS